METKAAYRNSPFVYTNNPDMMQIIEFTSINYLDKFDFTIRKGESYFFLVRDAIDDKRIVIDPRPVQSNHDVTIKAECYKIQLNDLDIIDDDIDPTYLNLVRLDPKVLPQGKDYLGFVAFCNVSGNAITLW